MEMQGRLIRTKGRAVYLCSDGTIAEANEITLTKIFTGFRNAELIRGNLGRWKMIPTDKMESVPGETLAVVFNKALFIYDSSAFNSILSGVNPKEYITASEYAKLHKRSISRIKTLCSEGRVSGAVRKGGHWLIPKMADYPEDRRKFNNSL